MEATTLLPDPDVLRCERVLLSPDLITIVVKAMPSVGICPGCALPSSRIHSHYTRILTDLPWHGRSVQMHVEARRFFCDTIDCPRRIFAERLPLVAASRARKTCRLAQTLAWIGFALGGEAGARLAGRLGMPVSPDALLAVIRHAPEPAKRTPRVLGVDDWAWRRGRRYGTILCDLEQHCPVDLLPERSAEGFSDWLRHHPGVEIISRDRGTYFAQGAAAGAPQAMQVADRWHLLHNLHEALVRALDRHHRDLREAARAATVVRVPPPPLVPETTTGPRPSSSTRAQQVQQVRRECRLDRYSQVLALHQQGISIRAIARQLGMNRSTVRRFLNAGQFPERADRQYVGGTDPFEQFLRQRWEEGCHNAVQLTRELANRGFKGSYHMVRRRVGRWRHAAAAHSPTDPSPPVECPKVRCPSANRVSWLLLDDEQSLEPVDRALLDALRERWPHVKTAVSLVQEFAELLRQHGADALDGWIAKTHDPGVPQDLALFADGLKSDYAAVRAAFTLQWSNGPVEGQVNRLKLIKRTMYGRAGFDLLRQRVLHVG